MIPPGDSNYSYNEPISPSFVCIDNDQARTIRRAGNTLLRSNKPDPRFTESLPYPTPQPELKSGGGDNVSRTDRQAASAFRQEAQCEKTRDVRDVDGC